MKDVIKRYLEDAIAAEKSFESQLRGFAKEATLPTARSLFDQHADETIKQYEELTARLQELGGSTPTLKSMLAHLFGGAPKVAQAGHVEAEKTTQDLIMAFAVENAEIAMYEALSIAAETAGDDATAVLVRRIQSEEKATARKVWDEIAPAARQGFRQATADESTSDDPVIRYLQDAEAAERNFEDAVTRFSKTGAQGTVQALMARMSCMAKTQHERLRARLEALGATASASKSTLAHVLAFTPLSAQMGHDEAEKSTQHVMITFAGAAAEMAMYEALAVAATDGCDFETAQLARQLQAEEENDHRLTWEELGPSAKASSQRVFGRAA